MKKNRNSSQDTTMNKTKVELQPIQTPTTVEEFRENLKKYYVCKGEELCVQFEGSACSVPISEFTSITDLYKYTETGWFGNEEVLSVVPKITFSEKQLDEMCSKEFYRFASRRFWEDRKNFNVWEDEEDFFKKGKAIWYPLCNQIMRRFYSLTLGKFSGYEYSDYKTFEKNTNVDVLIDFLQRQKESIDEKYNQILKQLK